MELKHYIIILGTVVGIIFLNWLFRGKPPQHWEQGNTGASGGNPQGTNTATATDTPQPTPKRKDRPRKSATKTTAKKSATKTAKYAPHTKPKGTGKKGRPRKSPTNKGKA